jgi:hypothetical protein
MKELLKIKPQIPKHHQEKTFEFLLPCINKTIKKGKSYPQASTKPKQKGKHNFIVATPTHQ